MLIQKIKADMIAAMKAGDKERLTSLRFIISEISKGADDKGEDRTDVPDETAMEVLNKSAKMRKEAYKLYESQNRPDLAEVEKKELEIIKSYLPEEISDEEILKVINEVKSSNSDLNSGALMGKVIQMLKGKADPDRIKELISKV